jgi:hypothetical protein
LRDAGPIVSAEEAILRTLPRLLATISRYRFVLLLLLLLILGAALQGMLATSQWVNQDEGEYVQSALAVSHGAIPLVTFPSRSEPVVPVLMAPVVMAFGASVLVGRAFEIAFNLLTAIVIAFLARRLCSSRKDVASLASAGAYLFIPFVAHMNIFVIEEPVTAFFLSLSLFFLLRDRWSSWLGNYPISGLLLGIAILSRRSALAVGVVWLVWILYVEKSWRARIASALRCFAPGIVVAMGFFLYVAKETSFRWAVTAFTTVALPYGQYNAPLSNMLEILGYLVLMAAPLFLIPIALMVNVLRGKGMTNLATVATMLAGTCIAVLLAAYPFNANWGLEEVLTPNLFWIMVAAFALWLVVIVRENVMECPAVPAEASVLLIIVGWGAAIMMLDFLPRPEAFSTYASDALAPLSLLFGIWFTTLIPKPVERAREAEVVVSKRHRSVIAVRRYGISVILVVLVVVSSAAVSVLVLGPTNPNNQPGANGLVPHQDILTPLSEIQTVGSYLNGVMTAKDTIFTFDTAFSDAAGRVISPPIAQRLEEYEGLAQTPGATNVTMFPAAPAGIMPSIQGLMSYWNSTNLTWMVDGPYTQKVAQYCPIFNWYLNTLYHPVASFGDPLSYDTAVVLQRGPPPVPTATKIAISQTQSDPVAVDAYNGTIYAASWNSNNVTFLRLNGDNGTIPIMFPGARSLQVIDKELWVGSTVTPQIEIIPLSGGSPELVTVGNSTSAFAVDSVRNEVFASAYVSGTITGLEPASNGTWWQPAWQLQARGAVSGLAVNSTSGMLYAAMPINNTILILNDSNGHVLAKRVMAFQPYALAYAQGGLDATWWAGTVYRLDISNGTSIRVVGFTFVGFGLSEVVSVPSLDAIVVPSLNTSQVAFLGARSLLPLGLFKGVSCPSAVTYDPTVNFVGVTDSCDVQAQWWRLPQYDQVTIDGAPDTNITVDGSAIASYQPPLTLEMWPQVVSLSVAQPGHLPGFTKTTLPTGNSSAANSTYVTDSPFVLTMVVSSGPSLSSISALQNTFTEEVIIMAVLAVIGGVSLLLYEEPENRRINPSA